MEFARNAWQQEMKHQIKAYKKENDPLKWVTGSVFGAEFEVRPREFVCPKTSLYFPQGRKKLRKRLELALNSFAGEPLDFCYHQILLSGKGTVSKMAGKILGEIQKTNPRLKIKVLIPDLLSRYKPPRRYLRRFRHCNCEFVLYRGAFWQLQFYLMLHSETVLYFDVNPDSLKYYEIMSDAADCGSVNLALDSSWKAFYREGDV